MNRTRVEIDSSTCCGTSNCAEAAPDAYTMDDRARPHVRPGASDEALLRGAEACPMCAITVIELATGRRLHP